jgi:hypothetical protein
MLNILFILVIASSGLGFNQPAGEEQDKSGSDTAGENRDSNTSRRDARRQERRERWSRYAESTPEDRRRMRVDRMVEWTARNYELDDVQKELVRREIEAAQEERRMAMGADAAEFDRLQAEMIRLRTSEDREDGDRRRGRDDPEVQKLREQLRAIEDKYPRNWDESIARIEKLLPEEQARAGHQRLEARRERSSDRRERRRDRDESRLDRKQSMRRMRTLDESKPTAETIPTIAPPAAPPAHPWEQYVENYISHNELTPTQASSAMAILKDLRTRAEAIEHSQRDKRAEIEKLSDKSKQSAGLAELNAPVNQLFEELQRRLDGLLTAAQRERTGR